MVSKYIKRRESTDINIKIFKNNRQKKRTNCRRKKIGVGVEK